MSNGKVVLEVSLLHAGIEYVINAVRKYSWGRRPSRREQSTFRNVSGAFPAEFATSNQKHYPDLGSNTLSVGNFCARF